MSSLPKITTSSTGAINISGSGSVGCSDLIMNGTTLSGNDYTFETPLGIGDKIELRVQNNSDWSSTGMPYIDLAILDDTRDTDNELNSRLLNIRLLTPNTLNVNFLGYAHSSTSISNDQPNDFAIRVERTGTFTYEYELLQGSPGSRTTWVSATTTGSDPDSRIPGGILVRANVTTIDYNVTWVRS